MTEPYRGRQLHVLERHAVALDPHVGHAELVELNGEPIDLESLDAEPRGFLLL